MRLRLPKHAANEKTFKVKNLEDHFVYVPRQMVEVVDETDGAVEFEASTALLLQLKLVEGPKGVVTGRAQPSAMPLLSDPSRGAPVERTYDVQTQVPFAPEARLTVRCTLTEGRYTVVFNGDASDYVTIKVAAWDSRPNTWIFMFLSGPDNGTDYTPFAEFYRPVNRFRVWRHFQAPGFKRQVEAVRHLLGFNDEAMYEAGEAYALRSSNCCKCGRDLTVAKSIKRGMGPECWQKYAPLTELIKEMGRKTTVIVTSADGQRAVPLDEVGGAE